MTDSNREFIEIMINDAARDPEIVRYAVIAAGALSDSPGEADVTEEFAQTAAERLRWYGISKRHDVDSVFAAFLANEVRGHLDGEA